MRKIKLSAYRTKVILLIILVLSAGCSSGNRMISNRDGEIRETEYISPDSIPEAYRPDKYLLGYGDMMDIILIDYEKYSREYITVRPDGRISCPYLGEIDVTGMTVQELDDHITRGFSEIIKRPEVSIIIREFRPLNIYVLGEVELPGIFEVKEARTVLEALSMAKGLTDEAKRNGVLLIRKTGPNHIVGIEIDINRIIKDNRYEYNIKLEGNDIVMVPKQKISRLSDFVNNYLGVLDKPFDFLRIYYYIRQAEATYEHFVVRDN
ncbi:MAG: hypothetical protein GF417_07975 [Candidatus Latescibacteria bacterium]|nr:hypothetical protein [bacterium]MBD3424358.1 hypothetical protein [Candidatus Latescibacterota bacterium]